MDKKVHRKKLKLSDVLPFLVIFIISTTVLAYLIGSVILIVKPIPMGTFDTTSPEIALEGEQNITLNVGDIYTEPGATATDDSGEVDVEISGTVHTSKPAKYTILYTATDSAGNVTTATRVVKINAPYRGTIYLTFDDGPGPYTAELLDILAKYNVKATFFVTCAGDDSLITREYNEGHTVGLHTCSHDYSYVYANMDNFFSDLYTVQERVKNLTGGYVSTITRFPGGSSNTVSAAYDGGQRIMTKLVNEVTARGFTYFDWNISSGDAGSAYDSWTVYQNVVDRLGDGGNYVVLQHDIKDYSVKAVENIIEYGLNNGYSFDKLTVDSFTAHHGINN